MTLTVGSLFSGIGGIDLGLERAGMTVKWHSEIDPFACRVLKKHWPHVPNLGNITEIDWSNIPYVDVIAGGYPCQPFSLAGKRGGENDIRHLWPYFRNSISALRPRYALLENVRGHLSMGGVSVIGDLAALGYDCEWRIISAASVGANHRRDRLIIVAYSTGRESREQTQRQRWEGVERGGGDCGGSTSTASSHSEAGKELADTDGGGMEGPRPQQSTAGASGASKKGEYRSIASWWQIEPNVGRVAHGIPSRVDRLRGLGNAVVPQVAEIVGRLIMEHSRNA